MDASQLKQLQQLDELLTQTLKDILGKDGSVMDITDMLTGTPDEILGKIAKQYIDRDGESARCNCHGVDCPVNHKIKELLADPKVLEEYRNRQAAEKARQEKIDELLPTVLGLTKKFVTDPEGGRYAAALIAAGSRQGIKEALKDEDINYLLVKLIARGIERSGLARDIGESVAESLNALLEERRFDRRFARWLDGIRDYWDTWYEGFSDQDKDHTVADYLVEKQHDFSRNYANRVAERFFSSASFRGWLLRQRLTGYKRLKNLYGELHAEKEAGKKRLAEKIEAARPAMKRYLRDQETPEDVRMLQSLGEHMSILREEESIRLWEEVILRFYGTNRDPEKALKWVYRIYRDIPGQDEDAIVNRLLGSGKLVKSDDGDYSLSLAEAQRFEAEAKAAEEAKAQEAETKRARDEAIMIKVATKKELTEEENKIWWDLNDEEILDSLVKEGRLLYDVENDEYSLPESAE